MGSTRDKVKRIFRKTVKWGGAAVTLALLLAWIGSAWWHCSAGPIRSHLGVDLFLSVFGGWLHVEWVQGQAPFDFHLHFESLGGVPFQWWFTSHMDQPPLYWVNIPLWAPVLLVGTATLAAWRLDSLPRWRARAGRCSACGYDRVGLAAGSLCPECGKQPEAR